MQSVTGLSINWKWISNGLIQFSFINRVNFVPFAQRLCTLEKEQRMYQYHR